MKTPYISATKAKTALKHERSDFTREEINALDNNEFPLPLEKNRLEDIIRQVHADINEENVNCAVCDEIVPVSKTKISNINYYRKHFSPSCISRLEFQVSVPFYTRNLQNNIILVTIFLMGVNGSRGFYYHPAV